MCVVLEAMLGRGAAAIEEIKSIPVSEFNVFVLEKILLRYPIADCQLHIIMINGKNATLFALPDAAAMPHIK